MTPILTEAFHVASAPSGTRGIAEDGRLPTDGAIRFRPGADRIALSALVLELAEKPRARPDRAAAQADVDTFASIPSDY